MNKSIGVISSKAKLLEQLRDHTEAANFKFRHLEPQLELLLREKIDLLMLEISPENAKALFSLAGYDRSPIIGITDLEPTSWHYRSALELGAKSLRQLPLESPALLADLMSLKEQNSSGKCLICVPGSGGAGSSWLALALTQSAKKLQFKVTLSELDPLNAGIHKIADTAHLPGARWQDLGEFKGLPNGNVEPLMNALVRFESIYLLGFGNYETRALPSQAPNILGLLNQGSDLLIIDAGNDFHTLTKLSGTLIFTVIATEFGVASASVRLKYLKTLGQKIVLAVRYPRQGSVFKASEISQLLDLPLALEFDSFNENVIPLRDFRPNFKHRKGLDAACLKYLSEFKQVQNA